VKTGELKERCDRIKCSAGDVFENPVSGVERRSEFLPREKGVELPCEQEFEYFATSSLLDFAAKYYAVSGFFFPSGRQHDISHVFCSVTLNVSFYFIFQFKNSQPYFGILERPKKAETPPLPIYIFRNIRPIGAQCLFLFLNSKTLTSCVNGSAIGWKLLEEVEMNQSVTEIVGCNDFEFALH